jgi:biopolymer transport protein ExbD
MLPSKAAALRAKKRRSHYLLEIDPSPFLAVAIVMLVTMMLVPPTQCFCESPSLVKIRNARPEIGARRDDAIKLYVSRDGRIYFDSTQSEADMLPQQIRAAVATGAEPKIFLDADDRARNGDVSHAIDAIRSAGIVNVAIMTEHRAAATK